MALDKVIDSTMLDAGMKATADAIREKTGNTSPIAWDSTNGFKTAVEGIQAGGGEADDYERFARLMTGDYVGKKLDNLYFAVPYGTTTLRENMFYDVRSDNDAIITVTLPNTITTIKSKAFDYAGTINIGELPPYLEIISGNAFTYARNIFGSKTELEIPASLKTLGSLAFYRCNSGATKTITFKGKPDSIANNALQNDATKTINVPWAEGEVSGAPWGATNATINYNYTGG